MSIFEVTVTETYKYEITVNAINKLDAIKAVREYYHDSFDGTFAADAGSFSSVGFEAEELEDMMNSQKITLSRNLDIFPKALERGGEVFAKLQRRRLTEELLEAALDHAENVPNFGITIKTDEMLDGKNGRPLMIQQTATLFLPAMPDRCDANCEDLVAPIRCKDCRNYITVKSKVADDSYSYCRMLKLETKPDFYCGHGEKEDG